MSFVDLDDPESAASGLIAPMEEAQRRTRDLAFSATSFASAMTRAFAQASAGGRQFDDVLKAVALRLSRLALTQALKPLTQDSGGLQTVFNGLLGATPAITPFAAGGVIGTPTYFPLMSGGVGLAGEAGPEAIMPLTRGTGGRLGVAISGEGRAASITVHIATPDVESFRRSEAYITGQVARAVARGQRSF